MLFMSVSLLALLYMYIPHNGKEMIFEVSFFPIKFLESLFLH